MLSSRWCVWELAIYLRAHPNPHVTFISISMRNIEIWVILIALLANLIVVVVEDTTAADAVQATAIDSAKTGYEVELRKISNLILIIKI